jgi:hypothetical protein
MPDTTEDIHQNRWRLAIGFLALGSLFLILAAVWFGWEPWNSFRFLNREGPSGPGTFRHPWIVHPPTLLSALSALFTLYLGGVLALFVFPQRVKYMSGRLSQGTSEIARLAVLGLVVTVLTAAIGISSALAVGTFPLIFILAAALFLSGFIGYVALGFALGKQLLIRAQWEHLSPLYALLLGIWILFGLSQVPFLGLALKVIFLAVSIGVVIDSRFGTGQPWSLSVLRRD